MYVCVGQFLVIGQNTCARKSMNKKFITLCAPYLSFFTVIRAQLVRQDFLALGRSGLWSNSLIETASDYVCPVLLYMFNNNSPITALTSITVHIETVPK